jgi:uncharacterized repeat protein (TIGR01451 family)
MKNHFLALSLILLICFAHPLQAQIVAVSDGGSCVVSAFPQTVITNVLANDVVNGVPATLSNVILRQLSTNNPNVQLQADGSVVAANNDELAIIRYEICDVANPNICTSGYIKIFDAFSGVSLPTVTILEPPTCTQPFAKVQLSNFPTDANYSPSGSWVIYLSSNPVDYDYFGTFYSDAGQPAIYENLAPGNYTYILSDIGLDMHHALGGFVIPEADCNIKLTFDGTITDTNTNGIQDAGDMVNYSFAVTNVGTVPLTNVTVTSPGLTIGGGPIASLAAGVTDTTSFTASYALTASDVNTGFFTHFATASGNEGTNIRTDNYSDSTVLHTPDGIRIIPFQDDNNNGVKDSNEYELDYYGLFGTINYTNSVDGVAHHISSDYDNAHIVYENNPAHTIAMSFTVNNEYSNIYSSTAVVNATVATGSGITNYYIPIAIIPHSDVNVSVHGNTVIRPGTSQNYSITLWNIGVLPIDSGVLTFTKSNLLSLSNASVPTVTTPNGFTHTYYNLVPGERRVITFTIYFPPIPTITNDDLFVFTAAATPDVNEISLNNNDGYMTVQVRNSYDPNNKTEEHNGQILHATFTANDYLTYTINFENTGNAEALDITVTDVLDDALDPTTVRMVGASHNYLLDRTGENLNWRFSNINLPVSVTDTSIGKGYLTFRVKPKPGYAVGDIIPNSANIYFDFNPPIVTAPCLTEFVNALATQGFAFENFKYSPNPVKEILKVTNDSVIDTITVTSMLGQTVFEKSVNDIEATIDLSALNSGIYLVKTTSASASKTFKIAKE